MWDVEVQDGHVRHYGGVTVCSSLRAWIQWSVVLTPTEHDCALQAGWKWREQAVQTTDRADHTN